MKWKKVKLTDISKPKQWKNLPISELTTEGFAVYGANGIIGRYKEYNHEFTTLALNRNSIFILGKEPWFV